MTTQQLIDKIMSSSNFQWKNYADQYNLHGRDHDITLDNIELHLHSQDSEFLNMMYEANCWDEVNDWYAEAYNNQDKLHQFHNEMIAQW